MFCCFWFSSFSFGFWFRKLLSATRTTKNPKTSRKTDKKQKKQSILRNVWAKDFVHRHCFFWFSSRFLVFWFRKLLSATRTTKNPKTSRKQKNKGFSGMSGPLSSDALFFLFVVFFGLVGFLFFVFLVLVAAPPPPPEIKNYSPSNPIPHEFVFNWFFLCSMLRVAVATKSTNQGHEG